MPFISRPLLSLALLAPFPIFLLQQHLRLLYLYPTQRVSQSYEISARSDRPAKPNSQWLQPTSGDQWTADVPRRWLSRSEKVGREDLATAFATAFWGSWALKLEDRIIRMVIGMGKGPFAYQTHGHGNAEAKGEFEVGQKVLGGLFVVEAHNSHPATGQFRAERPEMMIDGPIILSWWLNDEHYDSTSPKAKLLGGYHSFAVQPTTPHTSAAPKPDDIDLVRLVFVSHLVVAPPAPGPITSTAPSRPTSEIKGLSIMQQIVMHFHAVYSRLLLDLAVRQLRSQADA